MISYESRAFVNRGISTESTLKASPRLSQVCTGRRGLRGSFLGGSFLGGLKMPGLSHSGWWFGTFGTFGTFFLGRIIPTDELHHFSEG